jgi:hypothetical protein
MFLGYIVIQPLCLQFVLHVMLHMLNVSIIIIIIIIVVVVVVVIRGLFVFIYEAIYLPKY